MPVEIPAVRLLPMSDRERGFVGRSIAEVQRDCFLRDLPRAAGRWRYRRAGLLADAGTIVLFQFQARVVALATFLRDERDDATLVFEPKSIRVFDPVDAPGMRGAWPTFRAFGHVKQRLNPMRYPDFRRRLKHVRQP